MLSHGVSAAPSDWKAVAGASRKTALHTRDCSPE
jgi:hypothetical protein